MKGFREQYLECVENGNLIKVKCFWCNHEVLVCKKYDTYCHSKACKNERLEKKGE